MTSSTTYTTEPKNWSPNAQTIRNRLANHLVHNRPTNRLPNHRTNNHLPSHTQEMEEQLMMKLISNACTMNGWYWYCDEHDTHGNADSKKEAMMIAKAHFKFHKKIAWDGYINDLEEDELFDPNYEPEVCWIEYHHYKDGV